MVYSTVKIITSVCNNLDEPQESHLEKKSLLAKEYIIIPFMMEHFFFFKLHVDTRVFAFYSCASIQYLIKAVFFNKTLLRTF